MSGHNDKWETSSNATSSGCWIHKEWQDESNSSYEYEAGWPDQLRYNRNRQSPSYDELVSSGGREYTPQTRDMTTQTETPDVIYCYTVQRPEKKEPAQLVFIERNELCRECLVRQFQDYQTSQPIYDRKPICIDCRLRISRKRSGIMARFK